MLQGAQGIKNQLRIILHRDPNIPVVHIHRDKNKNKEMISRHAIVSAKKPGVFEATLWRPINLVQHRALLSILLCVGGAAGG